MSKPLLAAARAVTRTRDKASEKAHKILKRIKVDDILASADSVLKGEQTETIFTRAINALLRDIKPQMRSAFIQSRLSAWNIVARTFGETAQDREFKNKNRRVINDAEQEKIQAEAKTVIDMFKAKSLGLVAEIQVQLNGMLQRGMTKENVKAQLEDDWTQRSGTGNPRGRITGTWQRAFIDAARDTITSISQVGQIAGNTGLGWR